MTTVWKRYPSCERTGERRDNYLLGSCQTRQLLPCIPTLSRIIVRPRTALHDVYHTISVASPSTRIPSAEELSDRGRGAASPVKELYLSPNGRCHS